MTIKVGIIDYGMGNLRSVSNAVLAISAEPDYVTDPEKLYAFDRLILPGVGAFPDAIKRLRETGMDQALDEQRKSGKPILGLCLGMQLMCSESEEGGYSQGLCWFDATVKRFPDRLGLKMPHIGWNNLLLAQDHPLFRDVDSTPDVYFVHSFRVECGDQKDVLAWCDYGEPFAAVIGRKNIFGMQFHPEKSQRAGLAMLRNFVGEEICLKSV